MNDDLPNLGPRKKVAKSLAEKLVKEIRIVAAPVSLQRVIEHLEKTHALDIQRIEVGEKVSGLLVVCNKLDREYATIGFNTNHPWCRRRFTIAHEIGHLLLGHGCSDSEEDGSHNETEANIFAAELLMPRRLLKKDYAASPDVPILARLYRVSGQSLSIQLMTVRLI